MTVLSLFMVLLSTASARAESPDSFQKAKQTMLEIFDKRIAALQSAKTCVTAAQDKDAIKKCHEALRSEQVVLKQK